MSRPRKTQPKSPELRALGEAIRELRDGKEWTQEELADHAGHLDSARVGRAELGQVNLTYTSLLRLARALDTPLSELGALVDKHLRTPNSTDK